MLLTVGWAVGVGSRKLLTDLIHRGSAVSWYFFFKSLWQNRNTLYSFKTFAGLRNSQTCICAKDISHFADYQHQHSGCDQPCVGNKTELCGGTTSVRVYRLVGQCVQGTYLSFASLVVSRTRWHTSSKDRQLYLM